MFEAPIVIERDAIVHENVKVTNVMILSFSSISVAVVGIMRALTKICGYPQNPRNPAQNVKTTICAHLCLYYSSIRRE